MRQSQFVRGNCLILLVAQFTAELSRLLKLENRLPQRRLSSQPAQSDSFILGQRGAKAFQILGAGSAPLRDLHRIASTGCVFFNRLDFQMIVAGFLHRDLHYFRTLSSVRGVHFSDWCVVGRHQDQRNVDAFLLKVDLQKLIRSNRDAVDMLLLGSEFSLNGLP